MGHCNVDAAGGYDTGILTVLYLADGTMINVAVWAPVCLEFLGEWMIANRSRTTNSLALKETHSSAVEPKYVSNVCQVN